MFIVIVQNRLGNRAEMSVGDTKQLVDFLSIFEDSKSVVAYKVVYGDAGVLKNMKGFGIGHLDKMVENFTHRELQKA